MGLCIFTLPSPCNGIGMLSGGRWSRNAGIEDVQYVAPPGLKFSKANLGLHALLHLDFFQIP